MTERFDLAPLPGCACRMPPARLDRAPVDWETGSDHRARGSGSQSHRYRPRFNTSGTRAGLLPDPCVVACILGLPFSRVVVKLPLWHATTITSVPATDDSHRRRGGVHSISTRCRCATHSTCSPEAAFRAVCVNRAEAPDEPGASFAWSRRSALLRWTCSPPRLPELSSEWHSAQCGPARCCRSRTG